MTLIDQRPSRELPSTHRESLPLPIVHYGGLYSTFVRFSEKEDGESFLCECARSAATNDILDRISCLGGPPPWNISSLGSLIDLRAVARDKNYLPDKFTALEEVLPHLRFRKGICHRCNQAVPSIDYGYELCFKKASFFVRRFGFYIEQWLLSNGLTVWGSQIRGVLPSDLVKTMLVVDTLETRKKLFRVKHGEIGSDDLPYEEKHELRAALSQQDLSICNFAEAQVRGNFEFPAKGKLAQAEYMLFLIFRRIFDAEAVLHRSRPAWLEGLELDIYVPSAGIAAEYQGHQHSSVKSFMHSNNPARFAATQRRDARKGELCQQNGIRLYQFDECDYLTEALVRERLGLDR
jgi:hypothetical protein